MKLRDRLQEGGDRAQRQRAEAARQAQIGDANDGHRAADHSQKNVLEVAHVVA